MSFFTKNRIRNWLLIFLLVTNVATISTILYHDWKFKQRMQNDTQVRLKGFIKDELKFSSEQNTKLQNNKKILENKKDELYDNFENSRIAIYDEFSKPKIDTTLIDSVVIQTGITFAEINKASILQYYYLFNLCNTQQKEKLANFFKDMATDIANEMKEEKSQQKKEEDKD